MCHDVTRLEPLMHGLRKVWLNEGSKTCERYVEGNLEWGGAISEQICSKDQNILEYYPFIWSTIHGAHTKCKCEGLDFATPNVDHRFRLIVTGDEGHYPIAIGSYLHSVVRLKGYVHSLIFLNLVGGWFPDLCISHLQYSLSVITSTN